MNGLNGDESREYKGDALRDEGREGEVRVG